MIYSVGVPALAVISGFVFSAHIGNFMSKDKNDMVCSGKRISSLAVMKGLFTAIILFLGCEILFSQDLIITNNSDTIRCKIIKAKGEYIQFIIKDDDELRRIAKEVVKYYKIDFNPAVDVPNDISHKRNQLSKNRWNIAGGFSYLTAPTSKSVPEALKEHIKRLRSGYHLTFGYERFFGEYFGIGARYALFKTKTETKEYLQSGQPYYYIISDDITIHFIAPSVCLKVSPPSESFNFTLGVSPGFLKYVNNSSAGELTGKTFGLSLDYSLDFKVAKHFYMGIAFSYLFGALKEYEWYNGIRRQTIKLEEDNYESLSRLDLSLAIRFYE